MEGGRETVGARGKEKGREVVRERKREGVGEGEGEREREKLHRIQ